MRSRKDLNISLLTSIAAAMLSMPGCGPTAPPRRCVDGKSAVVADENCEDQDRRGPVATGGHYPFRWYYGGGSGYVPPGSIVSGGSFAPPEGVTSFSHPTSGGTVHGIFGSSASGSGGE